MSEVKVQKKFAGKSLFASHNIDLLDVDATIGLTEAEANRRLELLGYNELEMVKGKSVLRIFLEQLATPMIWILAIAAVLAFMYSERLEGMAILGVIIINSLIGFFMELQARRSMNELEKLASDYCMVLRNGNKKMLASRLLTVGDIIILESGDQVPADSFLIDQHNLKVNESILSGESLSVSKTVMTTIQSGEKKERNGILFNGTTIERGNAVAQVFAIGNQTELGEISRLTSSAKGSITPLEKKLNKLGFKLIWITTVLTALGFFVGYLQGRDLELIIKTSIALGIAAIPEGLPIVATIALAKGMLRLARHKVIVKKLSAVETLGETQIIFTDKTGTLTENQLLPETLYLNNLQANMRLQKDHIYFKNSGPRRIFSRKDFEQLIQCAVLCNNATFGMDGYAIGDALEIALLKFVRGAGFSASAIKQKFPRLQEVPFDSETKIMATRHKNNTTSGFLICVKGATEVVLEKCKYVLTEEGKEILTDKDSWLEVAEQKGSLGLRTLAFAKREMVEEQEEFVEELTLIGLVGFLDPPRSEVKAAIADCKNAGIQVKMVTGDQMTTAQNISYKVGLSEEEKAIAIYGDNIKELTIKSEENKGAVEKINIFARVSPAQKLELIKYYQSLGFTCGMTGDGVNDTPALKKADIGIAMGKRGTDAAREAADLILEDDAFGSIVLAIEQGRGIFENIRLFVIYLMSCNLSELLIVGGAFLINLPLPLLPLQILFINMITDVLPALALGVNVAAKDVMERPPQKSNSPILKKEHWFAVAIYALTLTGATLGAMLFSKYYLMLDELKMNNFSFFTLIFAQLWHVFNVPRGAQGFFNNQVTKNKYIWMALAVSTFIVIGSYQIPALVDLLQLQILTLKEMGWIFVFSLIPVVAIQVLKKWKIIA